MTRQKKENEALLCVCSLEMTAAMAYNMQKESDFSVLFLKRKDLRKKTEWRQDHLISIEEMQEMLDTIALELPSAFYNELNGGVILLPDTRQNIENKESNLYILGEYHRDVHLGRYIAIYYGSFLCVFGNLPKDQLNEKLKDTLKHEFRHHLESLAGSYELEIEDAQYIAEYKNSRERN